MYICLCLGALRVVCISRGCAFLVCSLKADSWCIYAFLHLLSYVKNIYNIIFYGNNSFSYLTYTHTLLSVCVGDSM